MRAWLSWIFRGYRSLGLAIEPICQRVNVLEAAGKTFTAACRGLDATREHLRMAWTRIEALEKQNAKLAANALDARREADETRVDLAHCRTILTGDLQTQIDSLRRLLLAREPEKPAPVKARNWREVQQFTRDQEESDVPAR